MVDALVSIALEGILKKLSTAAANEVILAWGYREKLTTFHKTVDLIHAKLRDAESQKGTKESVMLWLKDLKDTVDEADDVFDDVEYERLRREVKKRNQMERKVPSLIPSLKKFAFPTRMGHKIENISKKLAEILKQANDLGLHSDPLADITPNSLHQVETDSFLDGFRIVGRENEALHIIELLKRSREEENLLIVPIVGMGGIGKTTLAKSVYNNEKIERDFHVRAWLCVSVKVDVNTLLARIYESLTRNKCEVPTRENLIGSLRKELGGKRYLLVLDDVWDESKEHWDDFRSCMLKVNSENGSSILVTSRKLGIGTHDMAKDRYPLNGLSDDQCWSIFEERAFGVGRVQMPELVEIGHDIVKKCHGLPLLVKVLGGMLRCYDDKEKWLAIKDSKVWDIEGAERVQSTLKLSFDNLPNSVLKQCFAYCSMFPKDAFIGREQLIQFWMALGLLQADEARNKKMEDVGNDIFQTLVSNSLLQDVEMDSFGRISGGRMHDLVHDLSLSLTRHENLSLVGSTIDDERTSQVKLKHLAMYQDLKTNGNLKISIEEMISKVFKEDMTSRTLRSLLFFNGKVEKQISLRLFKSLHILTLAHSSLHEIDESIGDLVHLRYLDLSNNYFNVLPRSIGKLYHLQTLKLLSCYNLHKLPEDVNNLINLRHFEFDDDLSPKVGQLTSLQTLSVFHVDQKKGYQIEELGRMKHLHGKLCVANLEKISTKEDAAKANLSEKKNVFKIVFLWGNNEEGANRNDKDVLEGLQPHANVKILEIKNFSGDNFPTWVMKMAVNIQGKWTPLDKLMNITLFGCSSCHNLPMLGNLPFLQKLTLANMDKLTCLSTSLGQGNVVTEPGKPLFSSLRTLSLRRMESLEKWTDAGINSSTMLSPVLEILEIFSCPNIIMLDEYHQHPLVSLNIYDCKNLQSIQSIQGLTSLESLSISFCESLSRIPDLHNQGHSLKSLDITNCENLQSTESIQGLTSLKSLNICYCGSLSRIPDLHKQCHSLKSLDITYCDKLTSLPRGLECLSFLNDLELGPFSNDLHSFPSLQGIEKLGSHLQYLHLNGRPHWESIPEEVKHLTALTSLHIDSFGMQQLPIWLRNMSSIRSIEFWGCKGLDVETVRRGAPREAIDVILNEVACI